MRETAHDVLKMLDMQEHQAVIVEHTDTDHPHVHILVNMIHPETGRSVSLSKDEYKLDRWCDNYELSMGVIRSPERRAKFAALDQGLDPPPPKKEPKRFQQPDLKPANENRTAKQRAAAIKADQEAYGRRLKATQDGSWKRRKAQSDALWNDYRTSMPGDPRPASIRSSTKSTSTSATATPCPSRSRASATGKKRANGRS